MNRRIESKTSRMAEANCLIRSLSHLEKRPCYKSGDYVSLQIMNGLIKPLLKFAFIRKRFMKLYPDGMYEYVIARTKLLDDAFASAVRDGTEQIVIFGAGFDTRGIRLLKESDPVRVFELDAPVTQNAKLAQYKKKKIAVPDNLIFVPIDFETQKLSDRLLSSGFEPGKKCLFLMEGLTMYLQPESVKNTLETVRSLGGAGSRAVFDFIYASVIRGENLYDGEEAMAKTVAGLDERFCFGIEKDGIEDFLSPLGYHAVRILNADALQSLYFSGTQGGIAAKVNGTHCIAVAELI